MNFTQIWEFPLISLADGNQITVSQLVLAAVFLAIGFFIIRRVETLLGRQLERRKLNPDSIHAIQRVFFYSLLIILVITAMGMLHIPITAMAFATGAIAIGVGFGAQAIINNFISGWILMSERPVRIGDFIEIEGSKGVVERIGNRSTRIRRVDGVHLLVPNSKLLEQTVINWTLVDHKIRTRVGVGVAYGSPVRQVESILLQAIKEHPSVNATPAPNIVFEEFGDSALLFDCYFWVEVKRESELRNIRSDIRFRIDELFHEHGIVIAFPQRDLHLDVGHPLEVRLSRAEESGDD